MAEYEGWRNAGYPTNDLQGEAAQLLMWTTRRRETIGRKVKKVLVKLESKYEIAKQRSSAEAESFEGQKSKTRVELPRLLPLP